MTVAMKSSDNYQQRDWSDTPFATWADVDGIWSEHRTVHVRQLIEVIDEDCECREEASLLEPWTVCGKDWMRWTPDFPVLRFGGRS